TNLELLPSHLEFVERVNELSSTMYVADKFRWKDAVKKAFTVSSEVKKGSEGYDRQKEIIDSIYRIDSGFAQELIQSVDKEESQYKKKLKTFYDTLEMSKKIKNGQTVEQRDKNKLTQVVSAIYRA